jgi:hypothetical protein
MSKLNEIPSEFIEPYLVRFLGMNIDAIAMGLQTPEETRNYLKGVECFISYFGGIHCRIATSNQYNKFVNLSDDEMIKLCVNICKNTVIDYD